MKKIIIDNLEFDDVKDACDYILEEMDDKYYDEFLDEGQEETELYGFAIEYEAIEEEE